MPFTAHAAATSDPLSTALSTLFAIAWIGLGATALFDVWLLLVLKRMLGAPSASFGLIGRWVGHMPRGRIVHAAIARAEPVRHELALGWLLHYAVGLGFAAGLLAWQGLAWVQQPSLWPALAFGMATVLMPLCLMQPALGAGFFARKTATPLKNCLRSLANHLVFGLGLYLAALALAPLMR
ncbi:DUF2938 domain-containing protein [Paucibacter sp. DJ1R-11]|uniref:DUF2938 domain-containing protein n=1 Tax=Paucibacter sp. DJ1R-11 TaxID=2893556 RepID=UPI0021E49871|nr:DUF2938 domain-containing protein [Paucibacter sp. DJ1R-11]MCV2362926.1 DUF2938 domain-containing protein [Paucibacter sp. DJ1R-11]